MLYGMFYVHQCDQTGGYERVFETYHTEYLLEDKPKRFETCRRQQKLNILRNLCISLVCNRPGTGFLSSR
jgi:hypothetical protein